MTFDEYVGIEYEDAEDGTVGVVKVQAHHCNPTGNINGGLLITLADNLATGAAGNAYQEKFGEARFMVGVDLHATMQSNQIGGSIRGIARATRVGRRVTFVQTQVLGEDDRVLIEVTTTHVPT